MPEVLKLIQSIKPKTSSGDDISNKIIVKSSSVLAPYVTHLINISFSTGVFPKCFKVAKVLPLHKGGPLDDPNNYRPISLLSSLSKVLEKAMSNQIYSYFNHFQLFTNNQYGFRSKRSTIDALLRIVENVRDNIESKIYPCCLLLDLKKAFDTVTHQTLRRKLEKYGIRGNTLKWRTSYLSDRTQYTQLNSNAKSGFDRITVGVPQGSILGP